MKYLIMLATTLFSVLAMSAVNVGNGSDLGEDCQNLLGRQVWTGALAVKCGLGPVSGSKHVHVVWDFAKDGGAIGAYNMGHVVPDNSIVERAFFEVITEPVSSGSTATVALSVESANDIKTATDEDSLTVGLYEGVSTGTMATAIKTTANREITLTIASEALTAGKIVLYLDYRDGL